MTVKKISGHAPTGKTKNKTKVPVSELEKSYSAYFNFQPLPMGSDPFKEISLYDYSVPVESGASSKAI